MPQRGPRIIHSWNVFGYKRRLRQVHLKGHLSSTCSIARSFMGDDVVTIVSLNAIGNTRFSACCKDEMEVRVRMEREQGSHGLDTVVVADRSNG